MKFSKALIVLVLIACWAGAVARPDKRDKKPAGPQIERVVAADPNVSISVCVASGDIRVHGWDRNQVRARTSNSPELELKRSDPGASESAKEIIVLASNDERRRPSPCLADADIEIDVPRGASVKVQIQNGDIQVSDVSAVQAKTMNGDINLEGIKRATEADALGGNVSLRNSSGSARLHSVGGNIAAMGVGPAAASDTFEAATVGGDVTIDKSSYVKVDAGSVGGDLNFSGPLARGARYEIKTISGDIHLSLPADSSFRLDARLSQNAEFSSAFPLTLTGENNRSPTPPSKRSGPPNPPKASAYGLQHISGVFGTGDALLTLSSFSGAVYLQKK
jgi:hypothetical protein